jgi:hypothetical protein
MTQLNDFARSRAFAQHLFDRIARHDVDHEEDERENKPQRGQSE